MWPRYRAGRGSRAGSLSLLNRASPQYRGLLARHVQPGSGPAVELLTRRSPVGTFPTLQGLPIGGLGAFFDGTTQSYEWTPPAGLAGASGATLVAWVHKNNTTDTCACGSQDRDPANYHRFAILWYTDGTIYWTAENGSAGSATSTFVAAGTHMLTMTYDSATTPRGVGYIDGIADPGLIGDVPLVGPLPPPDAVVWGTDWASGGNRFWNGVVLESRFYNRALTPTEVWQLYDPATRWELDLVPSARTFFKAGGVAPRRFVLIPS